MVQSCDTTRAQRKLDAGLKVIMFDTNISLGWCSLTRVRRRQRTGGGTGIGDGPRLFIALNRGATRGRVRFLIDILHS